MQKVCVCKRPYVTVRREQSTLLESRVIREVQQGGFEELRIGLARPGYLVYLQIGL